MTAPRDVLDHGAPLSRTEKKVLDAALAELKLALGRGLLATWRVYARPFEYVAEAVKRTAQAEPETVTAPTIRGLAHALAVRAGARTARRRGRQRRAPLDTRRVLVTTLVSEEANALAAAVAERWCVVPAWNVNAAMEVGSRDTAHNIAIRLATARAEETGTAASVVLHIVPRSDLAFRWTSQTMREDFSVARITVTAS